MDEYTVNIGRLEKLNAVLDRVAAHLGVTKLEAASIMRLDLGITNQIGNARAYKEQVAMLAELRDDIDDSEPWK